MIHNGRHDNYYWLVSEADICLQPLILEFHRGFRLFITAFDSGPLHLAQEELDLGWVMQREVAVSPPIDASLEIPTDRWDEWYVFQEARFPETDIAIFVNYCLFTLVPPEKSFNPAWEKPEYLAATQKRFWDQLQRLSPETYVAIGDYHVVASRNQKFIEAVRNTAITGQTNS